MRIGELAQRACVSQSSIRYYETIGLIHHPCREPRGYRVYTEADAERIHLIVGARLAGLTVPEIRELIAVQEKTALPSPRLLNSLQTRLQDLRRRVENLQNIEAQLSSMCMVAAPLAA